MKLYRAGLVLIVGMNMLNSQADGDDWPQWMGINRDGHWHETGIVRQFPAEGLKVKWRTPAGLGYAGPAVSRGRVFITDYIPDSGQVKNAPGVLAELKGKERVLCLDASSGETVWQHEYDCDYRVSYPSGPRATPTVDGQHVYTLGTEGDLLCLDADSGKVVWSKSYKEDYKIETPQWGFCGHPLVDGDKLICLVGGEGSVAVAFDKQTGKELWRSLSAAEPGYCPPTMIEAAGIRQLIIWHSESINSLNPDTGELYWTQPLKPKYDMSIMAPRQWGDYLFASGIGQVGALFKLSADEPGAEVVWRGTARTAVYCANSTPIIDHGVLYGVCCQGGQLRAVELETGKRLWQSFAPTTGDRNAGHGTAFLVKNGDRYFIFTETGDLVLAELSPSEYKEISRFHILEPTGEAFGRQVVWSHPAFADKSVFARNDKELVCVSLAD